MSKANVGDLIRVVNAKSPTGYKNGDILEVEKRYDDDSGIKVIVGSGKTAAMFDSEYTIHRKAGEESSLHKIEVNGKLLRIYTGTDVEGDIKTEVTVGIDEATGVMYVLGMKTEVVE